MLKIYGIEIDNKPSEAMAAEAVRGLAWRDEFNRGGTEVGVARARDIKNRVNLSLDTINRMHSFFSRHEVDKQGQGFNRGEEGYPSAGRIAWALWGGDSGQSWARAIIERIEVAKRKTGDSVSPKRFYSTAKLSERISETPEGFLICEGVPITRTGDLLYNPSETPITAGKGATVVSRTIEDITDPETIASFEGKPVTINHPDDFVTPENWRELAVGTVQNVRPGEGDDADKLLADLLITDAEAISAVKSKRLREVSCGYEAEYIEEAPGRGRQEGIIGNHVALVAAGRCGSECAIFDHAPKKEESKMTLKDKIMGMLNKAFDEDMKEEEPEMDASQMLDALVKRVEALEKSKQENAPAEVKPEEGKPEDSAEQDHTPEEMATLESRLARLEELVTKLAGAEVSEEGEEGEGMDMCKDADTIARAEILAPGIVKTADVKDKALKAAYATADGKAVIDVLLGGKAFDSADKDLLFIGASEMVKANRRSTLAPVVTNDQKSTGPMTAERINEINAARFGRQS